MGLYILLAKPSPNIVYCLVSLWLPILFSVYIIFCSAVCSKSDCRSRSREFDPPPQSHTFIEIDHEIICTVILLILLIHKGLFSVTSERLSA